MDAHNLGDRPYPRYTERPFPSYRYLPGRSPHPRNSPQGHAYGQADPRPVRLPPERWYEAQDYLYAIDLYNHGYWWESHEVFEGLWHAAGHHTVEGQFYRALIQLCAASVKAAVGQPAPAHRLLARGLHRLERFPEQFMGLDVEELVQTIRERLSNQDRLPASLCLYLPNPRTRY